MQALAFLVVFVYATHATQAIAFEWKPGLIRHPSRGCYWPMREYALSREILLD